MAETHSATTSGGVSLSGAATANVIHTLRMPPNFDTVLSQLAADLGISPEEVVFKAVAMFDRGLQAHRQGKYVGIADKPDELAVEFVGFEGPAHADPTR
jgi:hypothetical protein